MVFCLLFATPHVWALKKVWEEVVPGVYRSRCPVLPDLQHYHQYQIKTAVSLQGGDMLAPYVGRLVPIWQKGELVAQREMIRFAVEEMGIQFVNKPVNSLSKILDGDASARSLEETVELMADPALHPLVVFCGFGKDRTGAVVAMYRMKKQGWSFAKADAEFRLNGHRGLRRKVTRNLDIFLERYAKRIEDEEKCKKSLVVPAL